MKLPRAGWWLRHGAGSPSSLLTGLESLACER